jgi:hypothetical protein
MPSGSEGMPHGNTPMGAMHGRAGAEEQAPPPVETAPDVEVRASEMAFTPAHSSRINASAVPTPGW